MDKPGEEDILLRREYQGELIKVRVVILSLSWMNRKYKYVRRFPMIVWLKKKGTFLRIRCDVFVNKIIIQHLQVKNSKTSSKDPHFIHAYMGPDFK